MMGLMNRFTIRLKGKASAACGSLESSHLDALTRELDLAPEHLDGLLEAHSHICAQIAERHRGSDGPIVVGVNGAQGSGKTTFSRFAQVLLQELHGLRVCSFSIDDLYLPSVARMELAEQVHPLLATRGVPGTHDTDLVLDLLDRLTVHQDDGQTVPVPAFDKGIDDRLPEKDWPSCELPVDVILFEGWCVGIPSQPEDTLTPAINSLEENEDSDGTWRHYVNASLQEAYATLYDRIDFLVFFQVPGWDAVHRWRRLQEEKLRRSRPGARVPAAPVE